MRSLVLVVLVGCVSTTTHDVQPSYLFSGSTTFREMEGTTFQASPDLNVKLVLADGRRLTGRARDLRRHGTTWTWRGTAIDPSSVVLVRVDREESSSSVVWLLAFCVAAVFGGIPLLVVGG